MKKFLSFYKHRNSNAKIPVASPKLKLAITVVICSAQLLPRNLQLFLSCRLYKCPVRYEKA